MSHTPLRMNGDEMNIVSYNSFKVDHYCCKVLLMIVPLCMQYRYSICKVLLKKCSLVFRIEVNQESYGSLLEIGEKTPIKEYSSISSMICGKLKPAEVS